MPFIYPAKCPKCKQKHGLDVDWGDDTSPLGDHDCPKCGAKDAIKVDWETEYDLDPITDND
jgi:Zn ribbon nucleic-acid-binding protein